MTKNTVYIVDIEAVDTRYTKQWKEHLPAQLKQHVDSDIKVISGGDVPQTTTPGAFLNFGGTNVYKSKQLEQIGELFTQGKIKDGDYFLYTDAWNPTVIQLRYMAELLGVRIRIGGLWHAGSYDSQDFLGRLIGETPWARHAEESMYHCYDDNFFATRFHVDMFQAAFPKAKKKLAHRAGWPMEYLADSLTPYQGMEKRDLILFPHRIAPEKQPDIFRDLKQQLPQYEFVMCQEQELTKNEYHNLLGEAKLVFSANLQETLGISWYEGVLLDTIPLVPDRLSYSEMAINVFSYPSTWTKSWKSYDRYRTHVVNRIIYLMENYEKYLPLVLEQRKKLERNFFSGDKLYKVIDNAIKNNA